ncbi:MAG TPA: hypothetical protein VM582_01310 [Candidatus Thermoplasmatota archaeon]|nr:hypothetical protein [Candidatus Thermoplasmatota archaeon]
MATVKRGNVPPTHPTVWIGLALATIGLLLAVFAYTGGRVYDITYAFVALGGAVLALAGILVSAWGRSILSARAGRSRRAAISADALAIGRPAAAGEPAPAFSQDAPTIAAPREKKRFPFPRPRAKKAEAEPAIPAGVFAFRRREPPAPAAPEAESTTALPPVPALAPDEPPVALDAAPAPREPSAERVRVTLRCPQCGTTFGAEGARPFEATCTSCGFSATV